MDGAFEIRSAAHLRVFNTPATLAVFEAMLDGGVGVSAGEIAPKAGQSTESVHYHIKKLVRIGLAAEVAQRETGARPEKLFWLTHRRIELRRGRRGAEYVREVVRGVRLMLRLAEREYERGASGYRTRPRVARQVGWLTEEELAELDALESRAHEVFGRAQKRAARDGNSGRERVALTMVLSPVERPSLHESQ